MAKILIIDDDNGVCRTLGKIVRQDDHDMECVYTIKDGIKEAMSAFYDIVFLDILFPEGSGLDILPQIRNAASKPEIIIMTGGSNPESAELAISYGVWDYVQKPFAIEELKLTLRRALQYRYAKTATLNRAMVKLKGIEGNSHEINHCKDLLVQAAATDFNVLITGETGSGKELFARAIHENSTRSNNNFIVIDCAALPASIVESMLFGHEKGAFTSADKDQQGLVMQADRGTLFLDEIGELPLSIQKTFLRLLEERKFRPVGAINEVKSDFRLIAATNRSLDEMVTCGRFRKDLLYRIRSLVIDIPPLRDRTCDITDLAMYYMRRICEGNGGINIKDFSPEFLEALLAYHWPGNIRELIHTLERAISAAEKQPVLYPVHLPTQMRIQLVKDSLAGKINNLPVFANSEKQSFHVTLKKHMTLAEHNYLAKAMDIACGNVNEASRISGLSKSAFYEKLRKYKIRLD